MAQYSGEKIIENDEAAAKALLQASFGRQIDGVVELHPLEAAYLCERKTLRVNDGKEECDFKKILERAENARRKSQVENNAEISKKAKIKKAGSKAKKIDENGKKAGAKSYESHEPVPPSPNDIPLQDQYIIYRAMRGAGHVVRFSAGSPLLWRVYARGVGREQERAQNILKIIGNKWAVNIETLERELSLSRLLRLELVLGYVQDGKPCLIKISRPPIEIRG